MSGSSKAFHTYTRCLVRLDAGISISWAQDPDGSFDSGMRHHQEEETLFRTRMERATPAIEVLFDELEEAGHVFTAPTEPGFTRAQRGAHGMVEMCEVQLACQPALSEVALAALAERVFKLLVFPEPEAEPGSEEVEGEPQPAPAPVKPWWKFW